MNVTGVGFRTLGLWPVLVALAAALAVALYLNPPPSLALVFAGGIGTVAVIALAIFRYERAALLGFALLGIVLVQPAPPDFVLVIVIAIAAVTGRIDLSRVRPIIGLLLAALVSLNLISMFEIKDVSRAVLFLSITLYLVAFAVWLCSFVNSENRARVVVIGYLIAAISSAIIGLAAVAVPIPFRDHIYNTRAGPSVLRGSERVRPVPRAGSGDPAPGDDRAAAAQASVCVQARDDRAPARRRPLLLLERRGGSTRSSRS